MWWQISCWSEHTEHRFSYEVHNLVRWNSIGLTQKNNWDDIIRIIKGWSYCIYISRGFPFVTRNIGEKSTETNCDSLWFSGFGIQQSFWLFNFLLPSAQKYILTCLVLHMGVVVLARKRYDSEKREGVVKERLCTTLHYDFWCVREAHYQISVISSIGLCFKPRCERGLYYML